MRKLVGMLMVAVLLVGAVAIQGDAKTKSKGATKKTTTSTTSSSSTAKETGKHLDFMGIPINGTISSFSTKLASKGFETENYSQPNGVRAFSGYYSFYENYISWPANLYVFYIPTTKMVYKVRVVINCRSEITVKNLMDHILTAYEEKYEGKTIDDEYDGYGAYERVIYDRDNTYQAGTDEKGDPLYIVPYLGYIDIFMADDNGGYTLFVDFFDWENNEKYEEWLKTTI